MFSARSENESLLSHLVFVINSTMFSCRRLPTATSRIRAFLQENNSAAIRSSAGKSFLDVHGKDDRPTLRIRQPPRMESGDDVQRHSVADLLGLDVLGVVHHLHSALRQLLLADAEPPEPSTSSPAHATSQRGGTSLASNAQEGELRIAHARDVGDSQHVGLDDQSAQPDRPPHLRLFLNLLTLLVRGGCSYALFAGHAPQVYLERGNDARAFSIGVTLMSRRWSRWAEP